MPTQVTEMLLSLLTQQGRMSSLIQLISIGAMATRQMAMVPMAMVLTLDLNWRPKLEP